MHDPRLSGEKELSVPFTITLFIDGTDFGDLIEGEATTTARVYDYNVSTARGTLIENEIEIDPPEVELHGVKVTAPLITSKVAKALIRYFEAQAPKEEFDFPEN
tara:strand:- start:702 stop:1013 length:312 start_codon:yes stop_codon:yes gene_type:complete